MYRYVNIYIYIIIYIYRFIVWVTSEASRMRRRANDIGSSSSSP